MSELLPECQKKTLVADVSSSHRDHQEDHQKRAAIVQECRDYMESSGRRQLRISALGAALSDTSRSYLRITCQSLKQLLSEHPEEFEFKGIQNQQRVRHVSVLKPSELQSSDCKGDAATCQSSSCIRPNNSSGRIIELHRHLNCFHVETRSDLCGTPWSTNSDSTPSAPDTPKLRRPSTPQVPDTPSDWGTPHPGDGKAWQEPQRCFSGSQPQSDCLSSVPRSIPSQSWQTIAQGYHHSEL